MRSRGLAVLAMAVLMLGLVFYPQGAAQDARAPDADEATTIFLHFKGDGLTTVSPAAGNATEETANCQGRAYGARRSGTIVGEWGFTPAGSFQAGGAFKAEIWAKSDTGAKNAGFRVNINEGGNAVTHFFTDRTDLSAPHKFTVSGSMSNNFGAGTTVSAQLVWLSDPTYGVGPSGGGTFVYGSKDHDSIIVMTLTAAPVSMNVTSADREGSNIKINARVNESLGMPPDSLTYGIMIQGPATPSTVPADHIMKPTVSAGDNGTSVSWLWSFRKSKAQSGMYTFVLTVAYSNDSAFSNTSQLQIRIEAPAPVTSGLSLGGGSALPFTIGIVAVVVAVGVVVGFVVWRKLRAKKRAGLLVEAEPALAV